MARPKGIPSHRKGKTLVEEYGIERAVEIQDKIKASPNIRSNLGKKLNFGKRFSEMRTTVQRLKYQDPEYKERQLALSRAGGFGKGNGGYIPTEASKLKNRLAHLGRKHTEESKQKQSENIRKAIIEGRFTPKPTLGIREDLGFRVRSSAEANLVRIFNYLGIVYEYETKRFKLSDGSVYICDFYLPDFDLNIELKPAKCPKGVDKINLFKQEYPSLRFEVVGREHYISLVNQYNKLVEFWE